MCEGEGEYSFASPNGPNIFDTDSDLRRWRGVMRHAANPGMGWPVDQPALRIEIAIELSFAWARHPLGGGGEVLCLIKQRPYSLYYQCTNQLVQNLDLFSGPGADGAGETVTSHSS